MLAVVYTLQYMQRIAFLKSKILWMPKYIQYFQHEIVGLNPLEGQLDPFVVGTHKDISGSQWKKQAPWCWELPCLVSEAVTPHG